MDSIALYEYIDGIAHPYKISNTRMEIIRDLNSQINIRHIGKNWDLSLVHHPTIEQYQYSQIIFHPTILKIMSRFD